jgi:putative cardiolipin synthase
MSLTSLEKRIAKIARRGAWTCLILIVGLYAVVAAGLAVLKFWPAPEFHIEDALTANSQSPHRIRLLSKGEDSLRARLAMIRSAKKSLELEFFIYNVDEASRLLTSALIERAQAGVKVRVLVDFSAPVFQLQPIYARYLLQHGIEVRYYNTSANYRVVSLQHRSHRKLLIADGHAVITGGRNIGDEYFDLHPRFNFLDTDVQVVGPIVEKIQESFDLYWASDFSSEPPQIAVPLSSQEAEMVKKLYAEQGRDAELRAYFEPLPTTAKESPQESPHELPQEILVKLPNESPKTHTCEDLSFITDYPAQGENQRQVFKRLVEELAQAKEEVIGESPYFVIREGGHDALKQVVSRGVKLKVLTNSLGSTDAFYTVSALASRLDWIADSGIELWAYDGRSLSGVSSQRWTSSHRWGLHSKRAVIDRKHVLIGTYNVDPRSANLNSELMLICRNQPEFAAEVLADLELRLQQSQRVMGEGSWRLAPLIQDASAIQVLMSILSLPLVRMFDFLL